VIGKPIAFAEVILAVEPEGSREKVRGEVHPDGLAITPGTGSKERLWSITHLATGKAIAWWKMKTRARQALGMLLELEGIDWTVDRPDYFRDDGRLAKIELVLKATEGMTPMSRWETPTEGR
jgi:hypothetical protein